MDREFLKADNEFVDNLPYKSIDHSTFGLISEATSYVLVESNDEVHIRSRTEGLSDLKQALKDSGDPTANFELKEAKEALEEFAKIFEGSIKEKNKWEKTLKIARDNEEIVHSSDLEGRTGQGSIIKKILNFFR